MTINVPPIPGAAPVKRYHPGLVVLHWAIAVLILLNPLLADEGESEGGGQAATIAGLPPINVHMILGLAILVLLAIRLLMRWRMQRPDWASAGSAFLDRVGQWTHIALYFFAFTASLTGLVVALQTNRLSSIFSSTVDGQRPLAITQPGQSSAPAVQPRTQRPEGFRGGLLGVGRFVFRAFHELSWKILLALILLHAAAALYHQFFRGDNLLGRMWFGSRT